MARGGSDRSRRAPKDAARRVKKKPCALCRDKVDWVDYKDVNLLRKYMSDRGKIRARRVSGNCSQHQRKVALAIRTARELALVPYTQRTVTERGGGRGRRGERAPRAQREAQGAAAAEAGEPIVAGSEDLDEAALEGAEDLGGEEDVEDVEEPAAGDAGGVAPGMAAS
jgi:small subunit ribosomal protein S18